MVIRTAFLVAAIAIFSGVAYAEDVVILKDGKPIDGTITKETEDTVFIREKNGEEHGIDRADISKIQRDKIW